MLLDTPLRARASQEELLPGPDTQQPDQSNGFEKGSGGELRFYAQKMAQHTDQREELLAGLTNHQKRIDPKFFYDQRGSELFEAITQTPEYYPTRTERTILAECAESIADYCGRGSVLIEPGAGSCEKVRLLLESIQPSVYVPMDISGSFLKQSAQRLTQEFPWLDVHALCADFHQADLEAIDLPEAKRVVFYPGSTIGNMEPQKAGDFLSRMAVWIGAGGGILLGVDLHKSEDILDAAYNDSEGVTADFNLNVLVHINQLLDGDFELQNFRHQASYDTEQQRIQMHLISQVSHQVKLNGRHLAFERGEAIHTENSYKYSLEGVKALAAYAGLTHKQAWMDDDQLFSVHYLEVNFG